jgi:hypothetical protein
MRARAVKESSYILMRSSQTALIMMAKRSSSVSAALRSVMISCTVVFRVTTSPSVLLLSGTGSAHLAIRSTDAVASGFVTDAAAYALQFGHNAAASGYLLVGMLLSFITLQLFVVASTSSVLTVRELKSSGCYAG